MSSEAVQTAMSAVPGFNEAVARAVERRTWAILGTEEPDGSVHMTPLKFLFEDGKIALDTPGRSRKATNLRARPRATVLVETQGRMGWVAAKGTVELLGGDAAVPLRERIAAKYMTDRGQEIWAEVSTDDTVIVLTPSSWRSWSVAQMGDVFAEHGYGPEDMAEMFKPFEH